MPSTPIIFFQNDTNTPPTEPLTTHVQYQEISGTADSNNTLELFVNGVSTSTTTSQLSGSFTFRITLGLGDQNLKVRATDGGGVVSSFSNEIDITIVNQTFGGEKLSVNAFDAKIGYDKRAAAKRDLAIVLQDVEGRKLTDAGGNNLISEIEGFVTSELTSEKAVSVVAPTETRTVSNFYAVIFGDEFVVNKQDTNRQDHFNNVNGSNTPNSSGSTQVLWKQSAHIKIKNPDPTWRAISKDSRIQIASGAPITEDLPEISGEMRDGTITTIPARTAATDGDEFETFIVSAVYEIPPTAGLSVDSNTGYDFSRDNESGNFEVQFNLNIDPTNDSADRASLNKSPFTYARRSIVKERSGTWKIEEVFAASSEVSTTLLGIDRAETQLSLFSNVSTYGFNSDEFVFYTDNPPTGPNEWSRRQTESGISRYPATVNEEKNEGALRISTFPVPYTFPYPPLAVNLDANGNDTLGLYDANKWDDWVAFLQLGKSIYEYFRLRRDSTPVSDNPNSNYFKYNELLSRFLPAINIWDDNTYYGGRNYGDSTERYYLQIDIWTNTYLKLIAGNELVNPVSGDFLTFPGILQVLNTIQVPLSAPIDGSNPSYYDIDGPTDSEGDYLYVVEGLGLRGTGLDLRDGAGSVASATAGDAVLGRVQNPYLETFTNRPLTDVNDGLTPTIDNFVPGYDPVGGQYALLQSRQAFRYQPGRISGYTYGTRAFMDKTEGANYGEWGIFNDFDEYVFRREGANFYIVRRSNIAYDIPMLQELGVADSDGNIDTSFVSTYQKTIAGKVYTIQEVKLGKEKFNGDSLNGNGPSGYLLNTDEITMYKIEFGWYGAIGLRMYAYIPVEHGKARWVVVHTFVIENKLDVPSMGDPFFRFKYEVRIGDKQAPDLQSPQLLYKYGTSMYIDGGDEGTVNVYSQTSNNKTLPFNGTYTTLMGIYPKTNIVSGGGVAIPNKKIIIPKQVSITASGFCELNFTKCTACRGNGFVYMPNVTAGVNGITRKLKKLDVSQIYSDQVTLATINATTQSVTAVGATTITIDTTNIQYLRPGDHLEEDGVNIIFDGDTTSTRILSITPNTVTTDPNNTPSDPNDDVTTIVSYDITIEEAATNEIPSGTVLTFQPVFIDSTNRSDLVKYGLLTGDTHSKIIYPKIWNTYIGDLTTPNNIPGDTAELLMYVQGDRYNLDYSRQLNKTKIVANTDTEPFPPADFFGDFDNETFDVRLSQRNAIIASPNAVSGPISLIKFLNPIPQESTGQKCNWRMGFTPNRPILDNQNKLIGWEAPDGSTLSESDDTTNRNIVSLPESKYIALDYHQYNQNISVTGLETGEGWFGRVHPFTQDFRIGNPKGSYSGICSEIILEKQDPYVVSVTEIDAASLPSELSGSSTFPQWASFSQSADRDQYINLSDLFLVSSINIYIGTKNPEGGQIAIRKNNIFNKVVYVDTDNNGTYATECIMRLAGEQKVYQVKQTPQSEPENRYVIPIKLFKTSDSSQLTGESLQTSSLTPSSLTELSDGASSGASFNIGYNSVAMRAWFSDPPGGKYNSPNSYTGGALATGVFEFDAFPLYPFIEMYDGSRINGAEVHNIDLLGNLDTFNPQWRVNQIDGVDTASYDAGTNAQTGELNINGQGNINQTPGIPDDLVPASFTQVDRLSSSQIDRQAESLLRPGQTTTTLYINDETKLFDLTDIFGFDRKVITPDIVNTEAVFITGRSLEPSNIDVTINITYVEQL